MQNRRKSPTFPYLFGGHRGYFRGHFGDVFAKIVVLCKINENCLNLNLCILLIFNEFTKNRKKYRRFGFSQPGMGGSV
jgi:hypothetical protein